MHRIGPFATFSRPLRELEPGVLSRAAVWTWTRDLSPDRKPPVLTDAPLWRRPADQRHPRPVRRRGDR